MAFNLTEQSQLFFAISHHRAESAELLSLAVNYCSSVSIITDVAAKIIVLLLAKNNQCQWEDWFKPFLAVKDSRTEKPPAHGMECIGRPEDGEFGT